MAPKKGFRVGKKKYVKPTAKNSGQKALAIVKAMQQAINYKHNDYIFQADDVVVDGICYPLTDMITQGVGEYQRVGDSIRLAHTHINLTVHLPTSFTQQNTRSFRVVLVRGITENGTIPIMSLSADGARGVFDDTTSSLILARKADNNMRDTKIIFDKVYTLTPGQVTKREFRWDFKLGWEQSFTTTNSTTVTPLNTTQNGGIYLMMCADFNNGDILCNLNARTTFSDL